MTSAVAPILSWSRRHRTLVAVSTLALVLASAGGIRRLAFDTDVLSLLPRDGRVIPAFRVVPRRLRQPRPALHRLQRASRASRSPTTTTRSTPGSLRCAARRRSRAWTAARSTRPATSAGSPTASCSCSTTTALAQALTRFGGDGMRRGAWRSGAQLLTVPSPEIAQLVRQDPLGLFDLMRDQLGGRQAGLEHRSHRRRLRHEGRPTPAGDRATGAPALRRGLLARALRPPRRDPRARRRAPDRAPSLARTRRPPLDVEFAGGHRIAIETESLVRRESISNTVGSLALILPLLFFVFRSPWLVAIGSLPSAISLVLVLGALGFAGATLSAAATASAAMLFGLGVDGVVLLYVAYTHALDQGVDPRRRDRRPVRLVVQHAARHVDDRRDVLRPACSSTSRASSSSDG